MHGEYIFRQTGLKLIVGHNLSILGEIALPLNKIL